MLKSTTSHLYTNIIPLDETPSGREGPALDPAKAVEEEIKRARKTGESDVPGVQQEIEKEKQRGRVR